MNPAKNIFGRGERSADPPWDAAAAERLDEVPFFVRPLVRKKVAERVVVAGRGRVTLADFEEAEAAFRRVRGGKSEAELATMVPRENRPGVPTVIVEACHHRLSDCPNVLRDTEPLRARVESRLANRDVSERLRRRIQGDRVLYHHKLRFTLAGCPNGCSRPQIADFGLVGCVRPEFDPELCTACGACAQACPDQALTAGDGPPIIDMDKCQGCTKCRDACPVGAVTLGPAGIRLLVGGKLGRHPRLARPVLTTRDPGPALERIDTLIEKYLAEAEPGERFADFYGRSS